MKRFGSEAIDEREAAWHSFCQTRQMQNGTGQCVLSEDCPGMPYVGTPPCTSKEDDVLSWYHDKQQVDNSSDDEDMVQAAPDDDIDQTGDVVTEYLDDVSAAFNDGVAHLVAGDEPADMAVNTEWEAVVNPETGEILGDAGEQPSTDSDAVEVEDYHIVNPHLRDIVAGLSDYTLARLMTLGRAAIDEQVKALANGTKKSADYLSQAWRERQLDEARELESIGQELRNVTQRVESGQTCLPL